MKHERIPVLSDIVLQQEARHCLKWRP